MKKNKRGGGNIKATEILKKSNEARRFTNERVFVKDSSYPRHRLKERILLDRLIKYECNICGIGPIWNENPMPLVLDHRNGLNDDNRLENLRFVCSNCDSQLDTYKSRNKKKSSF